MVSPTDILDEKWDYTSKRAKPKIGDRRAEAWKNWAEKQQKNSPGLANYVKSVTYSNRQIGDSNLVKQL